jgi:DNA-binding SARP family transcriptional activator
MNSSLTSNVHSLTTRGKRRVSDPFFQRSSEHLQQEEYTSEVESLISIYSHIQQKTQELLALSSEIHAEMKAMQNVLATLPTGIVQEHRKHNEPGTPDSVPPVFYVTCFGLFVVHYQGRPVKLCSNRNGQAILRFLVAQQDHSASTDVLMDLFWPEDTTDVALRKLHVTLSILRHALRRSCDFPSQFIVHKQGIYQIDPCIELHSDAEEFLALYHAGQKTTGQDTIRNFEKACELYTRPFLLEDLYFNWSFSYRERFRQMYLHMSSVLAAHYLELGVFDAAIQWAMKILKENPSDEVAHQQLMRIYIRQGRRNDALRQYQSCCQILREELDIQPLPATEALYQAILQGTSER